jgi:hypothetical protein
MPRNYDREYETYQGTPEQIKNRASRNAARRKMEKKHGKAALNGKDIDHKDGNPRNNSKKNLRVTSKSLNRSKK